MPSPPRPQDPQEAGGNLSSAGQMLSFGSCLEVRVASSTTAWLGPESFPGPDPFPTLAQLPAKLESHHLPSRPAQKSPSLKWVGVHFLSPKALCDTGRDLK